jgi:hypothetical protein
MRRLRRWCLYENDICTLWFDRSYRNRKLALWCMWTAAINDLGLNRPYSRMLCRLGIYTQYQPGVCGWCGERHVKVSNHFRQLGYGR